MGEMQRAKGENVPLTRAELSSSVLSRVSGRKAEDANWHGRRRGGSRERMMRRDIFVYRDDAQGLSIEYSLLSPVVFVIDARWSLSGNESMAREK